MKNNFDKKKYDIDYAKENLERVYLKLNKTYDKEIIEKLGEVKNKQGYIKFLIENDIYKKKCIKKLEDRIEWLTAVSLLSDDVELINVEYHELDYERIFDNLINDYITINKWKDTIIAWYQDETKNAAIRIDTMTKLSDKELDKIDLDLDVWR